MLNSISRNMVRLGASAAERNKNKINFEASKASNPIKTSVNSLGFSGEAAPFGYHDTIYIALQSHLHQPHRDIGPSGDGWVRQGDINDRHLSYYELTGETANLPNQNAGIQVDESGTLMTGLFGRGQAGSHLRDMHQNRKTPLGNPRFDLVTIPYFHALLPAICTGKTVNPDKDGNVRLFDERGNLNEDMDAQLQFKMHDLKTLDTFGGPVSKGVFPTECSLDTKSAGTIASLGNKQWVLADNMTMNRATEDCPDAGVQSNLIKKPPQRFGPNGECGDVFGDQISGQPLNNTNKADRRNPAQGVYVTPKSFQSEQPPIAPIGLRPHWVEHVDPKTGEKRKIIVIPVDRGTSEYGQPRNDVDITKIIDGYRDKNGLDIMRKRSKDELPPLIVLCIDGDNHGSNGDDFWRNFPDRLANHPYLKFTTIQDYLTKFTPPENDVVHIQPGPWEGAKTDQQFYKRNGRSGWTSFPGWQHIIGAKNEVYHAESLDPHTKGDEGLRNMMYKEGKNIDKAWAYYLQSTISCFTYDGCNAGDPEYQGNIANSANKAREHSRKIVNPDSKDVIGPTMSNPLRFSYNPGLEGFKVQAWAYDYNGIAKGDVKIHIRKDANGKIDRKEDMMYEGEGVEKWDQIDGQDIASVTMTPYEVSTDKSWPWEKKKVEDGECHGHKGVLSGRALSYESKVDVKKFVPKDKGALLQYYIEAKDKKGNITKSPIQNVWVDGKVKPTEDAMPIFSNVSNQPVELVRFDSKNSDDGSMKVGFKNLASPEGTELHMWSDNPKWEELCNKLSKDEQHQKLLWSDGKAVHIPLASESAGNEDDDVIGTCTIPEIREFMKGKNINYMFKIGNAWPENTKGQLKIE